MFLQTTTRWIKWTSSDCEEALLPRKDPERIDNAFNLKTTDGRTKSERRAATGLCSLFSPAG